MTLSVLSNINIDPLKNDLLKVGFDNPAFAGYDQYMLELINPQSELNSNTPNLVFFHLDGEILLKVTSTNGLTVYNNKYFKSFVSAVELFAKNKPNISIIISGIVLPPYNVYTHLNGNANKSFTLLQNKVNVRIAKLAKRYSNIFYFDFPAIVAEYGIINLVDEKFWYLGRIKYTNLAFKQIAINFKTLVDAIIGKTKKVLVLDLDNTLWGGVIGEDGMQGIQISEDHIGKVYRDFQNNIKQLKSIGILLAICSKNNEADALEALDHHNMMILKSNDFSIKKINWNNKADNIRLIAKEMNLGLDSLVFIDDNPIERELVRQNVPEVIVPEFPKDIDQLNKWFIKDIVYPYFSKVTLTAEDVDKSEQYERNIKRKSLEISLDLKEYIKTLGIKLVLSIDDKNCIPRVSQLTQKTNQFNLTTKRYTEGEIEQFMDDEFVHVYSVEYSDKYGKEGIIAVVIIRLLNDKTANLDSFLMSCRVIGRNVEYSILNKIVDHLAINHQISQLKAECILTSKNILAKEFYTNCGFEETVDQVLSLEKLISNIINKL